MNKQKILNQFEKFKSTIEKHWSGQFDEVNHFVNHGGSQIWQIFHNGQKILMRRIVFLICTSSDTCIIIKRQPANPRRVALIHETKSCSKVYYGTTVEDLFQTWSPGNEWGIDVCDSNFLVDYDFMATANLLSDQHTHETKLLRNIIFRGGLFNAPRADTLETGVSLIKTGPIFALCRENPGPAGPFFPVNEMNCEQDTLIIHLENWAYNQYPRYFHTPQKLSMIAKTFKAAQEPTLLPCLHVDYLTALILARESGSEFRKARNRYIASNNQDKNFTWSTLLECIKVNSETKHHYNVAFGQTRLKLDFGGHGLDAEETLLFFNKILF